MKTYSTGEKENKWVWNGGSFSFTQWDKYYFYFCTPNKSLSCRQRGIWGKIKLLSPIIKYYQNRTVSWQSTYRAAVLLWAPQGLINPKFLLLLIIIHEQAHKILTKKGELVWSLLNASYFDFYRQMAKKYKIYLNLIGIKNCKTTTTFSYFKPVTKTVNFATGQEGTEEPVVLTNNISMLM